jgi:hypothetical protein
MRLQSGRHQEMHGWNHLGERRDIGPEKVEEILSYSY